MNGPIARATLRTSAVFAARLVLQASTLLLLTRVLGPASYGAFAGVMGLAIFMGAFSSCGMPLMQVRASARGSLGLLPYAIPVVALVAAIGIIFFVSFCLVILPSAEIGCGGLIAIGLAELLLQPLLALLAAQRQGCGEIARAQLLLAVPLLLRTLAAGGLVLMDPSSPVRLYIFAYLAAMLCALSLAWRAENASALRGWRLPRRNEWHQALGFAATELSRNGPTELDKSIAARVLSPHGAGLYSAGARMVAAAVLPVTAMTASALPRLFQRGEFFAVRKLVVSMSVLALVYGSALAVILWVCAPWMGSLLGNAYFDISTIVRYLCVVVPGLALRLVAGNVLMALGQPWRRVAVEVLGVLVLVCAGAHLAAIMGALGMAIALACSEWAMALLASGLVASLLSSSKRNGVAEDAFGGDQD